jgi:RNA polymerase sigma-70 factor, ECF subfamily
MVAVLSGNAEFAGRSALRTWLVGILKHKIMDAYRERGRTPASLDAMEEAGTDPAGHDAAQEARTSNHIDPAAAFERTRFWETFERELGRMPARTASAFVMSELSGMHSDDVCKELGITANFLGVMRHRAKAMLRLSLAPEYAS